MLAPTDSSHLRTPEKPRDGLLFRQSLVYALNYLMLERELDKAREHLDLAEGATAYNELYYCYLLDLQGKPSEADQYYEQFLQKNSDEKRVRFAWGIVLFHSKVLTTFMRHFFLGYYHLNRENVSEAKQHFHQALEPELDCDLTRRIEATLEHMA